MEHRRPLVLAALVALFVAACAGASAGWTYAPPPPATPIPSTEASAGASGAPSGAVPSGEASGAPSASAGAGGTVLKVTAVALKFDPTALDAPADTPFQIEFDNQDAGTPHNVAIHQGDASGAEVFKGEIFPGVAVKTYDVGPLAAGAYAFVCTVHPTMTGALTVQ